MGLDMYLRIYKKSAEKVIPMDDLRMGELNDEKEFIQQQGKEKIFDMIMSNHLFPVQCGYSDNVYLATNLEIGYWRKANAIHKWFVENVQGGEDDCGYYTVTKAQISELRDLCKRVVDSLKNNPTHMVQDENGDYNIEEFMYIGEAKELLPTHDGFFFGRTYYDEYYLESLRHTIRVCDEALYQVGNEWAFIYHSSW